MKFAAVTGTNGKTTSIELTRQLLNHIGVSAMTWGTLGLRHQDITESLPWYCNTPERIHDHVKEVMVQWQIDVCLMECFSRLLILGQYQRFQFDCGAFTNLSHDHRDYHKTETDYLNAKLKLTAHCKPGASIWLRHEEPHREAWFDACIQHGCLPKTFSSQTRESGWYGVLNHHQLTLCLAGEHWQGRAPFLGQHNVFNLLTALGLIDSLCGYHAMKKALAFIPSLTLPPGRLQAIPVKDKRRIFVDFAHNPDGLGQTLSALREHYQKPLTVVFGCGGDRDKTKRTPMAKEVGKYAQRIFITGDNSRTEPIEHIVSPLRQTLPHARFVKNRVEAIYQALSGQTDEDILVVAGRGHETYLPGASPLLPPSFFNQPLCDADVIKICLKQIQQR
ncbi:Mur ligase family protein [Grimontia sp. SpTr1]|uniref:Mur ligase family protein n=1 Tax=Grimontia sp. SpTr1 TaxID=2995319 RepID=UPI00248AF775|nr:Mur ligase family protein [Grimontia sp. SpTr1]